MIKHWREAVNLVIVQCTVVLSANYYINEDSHFVQALAIALDLVIVQCTVVLSANYYIKRIATLFKHLT